MGNKFHPKEKTDVIKKLIYNLTKVYLNLQLITARLDVTELRTAFWLAV